MKKQEIIKEIEENGGLDMEHIERSARCDKVSVVDFLCAMIKNMYNCHGKTARAVAEHYYYKR